MDNYRKQSSNVEAPWSFLPIPYLQLRLNHDYEVCIVPHKYDDTEFAQLHVIHYRLC